MSIKIFIDSDVIISSLISNRGAAFFLLNKKFSQKSVSVELFLSNYSHRETREVCKRMELDQKKLKIIINRNFNQIKINSKLPQIKKDFAKFTNDKNDCHIVAGAKTARVKFLITYNTKDYCSANIKKSFGIIIFTPAEFLQYLRNQD